MRKLACACLSFSAATIAANYILPSPWLVPAAVILALAGAGLGFLRRKKLRGLVIALVAAALGLGCFYARSLSVRRLMDDTAGKTMELSAQLLDHPQVYEDHCRGEVVIKTAGMSGVKAILYDNARSLKNMGPGQRLTCTVSIRRADTRYGEDYDYYMSRGFFLILNSKSDIMPLGTPGGLSALPQRLRHAVSTLSDSLFPKDTAPFIKSLMLGDKSDFYEDEGLYSSVSRAGLMHVVAVSGMHIAFLIGFLQLILGVSRRSSLICIALVWLFVFVTGSGPSAVRAGFMQTLLLLAPIVKRENDPVTALSAVLAAILLVNPYAAASVSLQLSFGAMAGIILFSGKLYAAMAGGLGSERLRRLLNYPIKILSCSLAVMVFTVPLSAAHFGSVSILAPLSNFLGLLAVSLCFCGAYAACGIGAILPAAGRAAAWLVSWLARYIFAVCKLISAIPFAAVYLNARSIQLWLLLTYALVLIAVFTKAPVKLKLAMPAALSALALSMALLTAKYCYSSGREIFTALDVGQGQCISVFSGESTVLVDCGGKGSFDNAGEVAGEYLQGCGRGGVDFLVLTHLHADHCNGVSMLAELTDIGTILIPYDADDEDEMLAPILETARKHNIAVRRIYRDTQLSCGDISIQLYVSAGGGDANERGLIAKLSVDGYDALICGDAPKSLELELIETHEISDVELLVVAHHGSRYSSTGEFLGRIGADTAIISVGYNTYGHPTYETLERLAAYGYNIYRTDLNGNIEFRIG